MRFKIKPADIEHTNRHVINKRDHLGSTPLHYAVRTWPEASVRVLLDLGANLGLKNAWGEIPLARISVKCLGDFLDHGCLAAIDEHGEVVEDELGSKESSVPPEVELIDFQNRLESYRVLFRSVLKDQFTSISPSFHNSLIPP